jgi:hypothetical protein
MEMLVSAENVTALMNAINKPPIAGAELGWKFS